MKKLNYLYTAILALVLISGKTFSNDLEQEKTKSFNVSKGGTLNVNLNVGNINVQTWDKDEVLLKVDGLSESGFKKVETNIKGNVLFIKYENDEDETEDEVTFTFTLPTKFNLDLKTLGGDISLKNNISGNVSIDTFGGEISSKNISGEAKIETKGGDIKLGDIDGDCIINTLGGEITIGTVKGKNVKVVTNGGDININKSSAGVNAKTYGGNITVGDLGGDSELTTYGGDVSVGSAKGNLTMGTYGGNLELKGLLGKVKGKTMGGDINFKKVDGSVELKTMSGTVSVELNPATNSESFISTNSGSIKLTISESAKTVIEARIHVQGRWKDASDNYKIKSDFNSQSYTMDDNKRDIVATYNINGGGSKINLKSVNDEITIKKGLK